MLTNLKWNCYFLQASWNFELEYLLGLLQDPGHRMNYDWIRKRIRLLWDRWVYAAKNLTLKQDFTNRPRMRVNTT